MAVGEVPKRFGVPSVNPSSWSSPQGYPGALALTDYHRHAVDSIQAEGGFGSRWRLVMSQSAAG